MTTSVRQPILNPGEESRMSSGVCSMGSRSAGSLWLLHRSHCNTLLHNPKVTKVQILSDPNTHFSHLITELDTHGTHVILISRRNSKNSGELKMGDDLVH